MKVLSHFNDARTEIHILGAPIRRKNERLTIVRAVAELNFAIRSSRIKNVKEIKLKQTRKPKIEINIFRANYYEYVQPLTDGTLPTTTFSMDAEEEGKNHQQHTQM